MTKQIIRPNKNKRETIETSRQVLTPSLRTRTGYHCIAESQKSSRLQIYMIQSVIIILQPLVATKYTTCQLNKSSNYITMNIFIITFFNKTIWNKLEQLILHDASPVTSNNAVVVTYCPWTFAKVVIGGGFQDRDEYVTYPKSVFIETSPAESKKLVIETANDVGVNLCEQRNVWSWTISKMNLTVFLNHDWIMRCTMTK